MEFSKLDAPSESFRSGSNQPADEAGLMPDDRENTTEIEHTARLDTFYISAKRRAILHASTG